MRPAFDAGVALPGLDERITRSLVGAGWIERQNFADACGSLWIDDELVHLQDLVLHDATRDIRTPIHELNIARDVLRTSRRIAGQPAAWALSPEGLRGLRGQTQSTSKHAPGSVVEPAAPWSDGAAAHVDAAEVAEGEEDNDEAGPLAEEFAAIDAFLARSDAAIEDGKRPGRAAGSRSAFARQMMERKLSGRRTSSKLPELVELIMAKPFASAGMVAKTLDVTSQAARRIVSEPGLREMTGRGRFRACGVL